jgi:hypothetical protein
MLSSVVNSRSCLHRSLSLLDLRHRDENPVTANPLESTLTNGEACNSFRILIYINCRVEYLFLFDSASPLTFLPQDPFCKPLVSYALRTLPSYVSCKSFACRSYENNRGVAQLFPKWNSTSTSQGISIQLCTCQPAPSRSGSPINSHSRRLTPSSSADSINLHPADRSFRRHSHPRGGGIP